MSTKISSQYLGVIIVGYLWFCWFQIKPSIERTDLTRELDRLKLRFAELQKEFTEHFGIDLQFKELAKAWDSPGVEIIEKLEDAALSEIKRCSQSAYREHLEKLVKMHTV